MTSFAKHLGLDLAKKLQNVFRIWKKKESKNYLQKKSRKSKTYKVNKLYRIESYQIILNHYILCNL